MIKKLNQILLLTAGFALGTSSLTGSPVLAGGSFGTVTVTADVQPYTLISVTPQTGATFSINYNTGITNRTIAKVDFTTNVVGTWVINPRSDQGGKLVSGDTTAEIPYQVRMTGLASSFYYTPLPSSQIPSLTTAVLRSSDVTDQVLVTTNQNIQLQILADDTRVPTAPTSAYTDTLILVFTSDL
jgi:hypothetical protein